MSLIRSHYKTKKPRELLCFLRNFCILLHMKSKNDIRIYIQTLFSSTKKELCEYQDKKIEKQVLEYVEQKNHICIYKSLKDEVATDKIIQKLQEKGKNVYIPKVISESEMILIDFSTKEKYLWNLDVCIIPGRAFTPKWERLGRGKWYYDRFLSQKEYKNSKKVGICYNFQILEYIPTQNHDILMDIIISS